MKRKFLSILPYIFISVFCLEIFLTPFGSGDELWNYNFAKNIAEGLKPYSDISMIQTPLSAYVSGAFLKIFGCGMLVYRVVGYLLMVSIFVVLYKLCVETIQNKLTAFLSVLFLLSLNSLCFIYNYNYLSVFVVLIIMYLELLNSKSYTGIRNALIGVLFGLLPLIKQTTGGTLFLLNLCVCIYYIFKKGKTNHLCRAILSLVPGILYLSYLLISSSFNAFMEYAVLGIGSFTHKDTFLNYITDSPINFFFGLIPILILLYIVYSFVVKKDFTALKINYLCISLIWLIFVTYPLCDSSHLFVGIIPIIPLFLLIIKNSKSVINIVRSVCFVTVTILVISLLNIISTYPNYVISDINNYNGVLMSKVRYEDVKTITKYIDRMEKQGISVYIADESSAAYTIPLDKYTKNWDMLLVGNLGSANIEQLLDVEDNAVFLLLNDQYTPNKQSHFELINYIKQNYECFDKVEYFDVYKRKE